MSPFSHKFQWANIMSLINLPRSFSVLPEKIKLSSSREDKSLRKGSTRTANFTNIAKIKRITKFAILVIFVKFVVLFEPFWRFYSGFFSALRIFTVFVVVEEFNLGKSPNISPPIACEQALSWGYGEKRPGSEARRRGEGKGEGKGKGRRSGKGESL